MRRRHVARPDACREPVVARIRDRHGLIGATDRRDGKRRTEDLFLADTGGIVHAVEHGGLDVKTALETVGMEAIAAVHDRPLLSGRVDVSEHAVELHLTRDGPDLGRLEQWIAQPKRRSHRQHGVEEFIVNRLVDDESTAAVARLAGIVENAPGHSRRARFDVFDVSENNLGRFAAQLERHLLGIGVTGVPQEVQLFPGTVRENVSMFDPDISDARIIDALSAVGLGPWLDAQTAGLDAQLLGRLEVATGMSAGEAQLLSLARALVRNPTIVVLDEATSRIDPATQLTVRTAVARLLEGRTAIVIAHRLDTLSVCDDIAVLAGGRIVEFGNRRSLAADPSSRFAHLLRTGAMSAEASLDDVLDLVGDPS